jgi:hypothetical protein
MISSHWNVALRARRLRRWLPRPQDIAAAAAAGGDPVPLLTEAAAEQGAFGETHDDRRG